MKNVITLGKLIGLLLFCPPPPFYFVFENSNAHKYTRNELARLVMGTIYLVIMLMMKNPNECRLEI